MTGSTGDGYALARPGAGHTLSRARPVLVRAGNGGGHGPRDLQGLALKNVRLTLNRRPKDAVYRAGGDALHPLRHLRAAGARDMSCHLPEQLPGAPGHTGLEARADAASSWTHGCSGTLRRSRASSCKTCWPGLLPLRLSALFPGAGGRRRRKRVCGQITRAEREKLLRDAEGPAHHRSGPAAAGRGHCHPRRRDGAGGAARHHGEQAAVQGFILRASCWTWTRTPAALICRSPFPPGRWRAASAAGMA